MASEKRVVPECKDEIPKEIFESPKPSTGANTSFSSAEKHSRNASFASSAEEYESEPASVSDFEAKRKRRMHFKDGKTIHPKLKLISRELRDLAKKHIELEKNLKIEGMPDPPRIRKRRLSLGSNIGSGRERDIIFKRKRLNSLDLRPKKDHMPKWGLMGGDATDPLNLNGLASSEEGRLLNLRTPENSPLPTPDFRKIVYVKVPPNIEDPLNLEGKHDQRVIDMLLNATRRKRHRSKKNKDGVNISKEETPNSSAPIEPNESVSNKEPESEKSKPSNDNGSPLKSDNQNTTRSRSISMSPDRKVKRQISGGKVAKVVPDVPKKFPANPKFTQGNYNRYYGYRNQDHVPDPRLRYFNLQWFENKDVLDIGCNVGHVTLALADQFSPRKILGMDVDGKLIGAARQNIRHLLSQRRKDSSKYPSVFEATRGPLEAHPLAGSSNKFPNNVLFMQGNYVPGSEEILQMQKEEYDTILALSITKWIHLNNGDRGLKMFFQKIHKQLRPGGRLILEPQPWSTYRKRAKLSTELFRNYSEIKLKPEGFKSYLLSIGFVKCEVIGVPVTKAKGFRRPLILFTKTDPRCPALSQPQNPTGSDFRPFAEYAGGDYLQCTGMRTGAYADRLYDHIVYRSSEPRRNLTAHSPTHYSNSSLYAPMSPCYARYSGSHGSSRHSTITPKTDSEQSPSSSFSGHGSQIQSGSERSWTSDSSHSSSSSSDCSSFTSQSLGNGEVAEEDVWVVQEEPAYVMYVNGDHNDEEVDIVGGIENGHLSGDDGAFIPNGHLSSGDDNEEGGGVAANGNSNSSNSSSEGSSNEELNNNGGVGEMNAGENNVGVLGNENHGSGSSETDVLNGSNEEG